MSDGYILCVYREYNTGNDTWEFVNCSGFRFKERAEFTLCMYQGREKWDLLSASLSTSMLKMLAGHSDGPSDSLTWELDQVLDESYPPYEECPGSSSILLLFQCGDLGVSS